MESMRIVRHHGLDLSHTAFLHSRKKDTYREELRTVGQIVRSYKAVLALETKLYMAGPQPYGHPPPSYDDAINDLPPEYSTLAPLAKQKDFTHDSAPEKVTKEATTRTSSHPLNFDDSIGIREHAKKKNKNNNNKVKPAPQQQSSLPPNDDGDKNPPPEEDQSGGDAGGSGDGNGDNGGDGGGGDEGGDGGDDDWGAWDTTSSKKKNKKKKKDEEEEMRKNEEEERLAKEEEEKKAAEEAAAGANNNDLSWADDGNGHGDDSWTGFASVNNKKNKKKSKVRLPRNSYRAAFPSILINFSTG
jgi:hypothetical protein